MCSKKKNGRMRNHLSAQRRRGIYKHHEKSEESSAEGKTRISPGSIEQEKGKGAG